MQLPNANLAVISEEKIAGYLLNSATDYLRGRAWIAAGSTNSRRKESLS
jgi:hypothetical protein